MVSDDICGTVHTLKTEKAAAQRQHKSGSVGGD